MSSIRCMGCMQEYEDSFEICPQCGYGRNTEAKEDFHLSPGTILNNKYIVGRSLGCGKNGITYLGWDAILETKVAIKEYFPQDLATRLKNESEVSTYDGERKAKYENGLESFLNAGINLAKFNYIESIVHIFDSFSANNTGYVIMEYLEGESVLDIINKQGKKSLQDTFNIVAPILNALSVLHDNGVIHGNICPNNILIVNGSPKLIDFNFELHSNYDNKKIVVTKGYSPIESYRSNGKLGPWTDIYSISATMYFMLTAKRPVESVKREENDTLQSIDKYVQKIPPFVVNAIMNGLSVDPKDRIKSANQLGAILTGNQKINKAKKKKKSKDVSKKSHKGKVIAIISAVVILIAGGVLFFTLKGNNIIGNSSSQSQSGFSVNKILGKTVDEANSIAKKYNKSIVVKDNRYDDGSLLSQYKINTIAEGSVDKNIVSVIVYAGKAGSEKADTHNNVSMPNLYAESKSKALNHLKEYGLKGKVVFEENDNFVGQVFEQSVGYGAKVKVGSTVTITVGKKVPPTTTTTVPQTEPPTTAYEPETYQQNNDYDNNYNNGYSESYNNNNSNNNYNDNNNNNNNNSGSGNQDSNISQAQDNGGNDSNDLPNIGDAE